MPRSIDLEAGALHHHRHQVLADVVDVALDGADHDLADRLGAGLGQQRAQDLHAGLHRVGGEQHLGHEQDAVAEVDADDAHALDQRVVEHPIRAPSTVEQDHRALDDLVGEAVVEVVVHLLDELVVGERGEIDLVGSVLIGLIVILFPPLGRRRDAATGARRERSADTERIRMVERTQLKWLKVDAGRSRPASGGSGVLPRIRSAAFSASIITGA